MRELVIERFELLGLAGQGGMGTVHRARDRQTGEAVAVKVLALAFLLTSTGRADEAVDLLTRLMAGLPGTAPRSRARPRS